MSDLFCKATPFLSLESETAETPGETKRWLQGLSELGLPLVGIIGLLGKARAGKSTLGNTLASRLHVDLVDLLSFVPFVTSSQTSSCTLGINAIAIKVRIQDGVGILLILDSQGLVLGSTRHEQLVMGLLCWLCTHLVYVESNIITYRTISSIATMVPSKLIAMAARSSPLLHWPELVVVTSDHSLDSPHSPDQWLHELLRTTTCTADVAADASSILQTWPQVRHAIIKHCDQRNSFFVSSLASETESSNESSSSSSNSSESTSSDPSSGRRSPGEDDSTNQLPPSPVCLPYEYINGVLDVITLQSNSIDVARMDLEMLPNFDAASFPQMLTCSAVSDVLDLIVGAYRGKEACADGLSPLDLAVRSLCQLATQAADAHFQQEMASLHLRVCDITGDEEESTWRATFDEIEANSKVIFDAKLLEFGVGELLSSSSPLSSPVIEEEYSKLLVCWEFHLKLVKKQHEMQNEVVEQILEVTQEEEGAITTKTSEYHTGSLTHDDHQAVYDTTQTIRRNTRVCSVSRNGRRSYGPWSQGVEINAHLGTNSVRWSETSGFMKGLVVVGSAVVAAAATALTCGVGGAVAGTALAAQLGTAGATAVMASASGIAAGMTAAQTGVFYASASIPLDAPRQPPPAAPAGTSIPSPSVDTPPSSAPPAPTPSVPSPEESSTPVAASAPASPSPSFPTVPSTSSPFSYTFGGATLPSTPRFSLGSPTSQPLSARYSLLPTSQDQVASFSMRALNGSALPGWEEGGFIPYSWGAGKGPTAGPTLGSCGASYSGPKPCKADVTIGVDCSGFTRWMYNLAFGRDRLAPHPNLNTKGMGGAEIQANDPTARLVSTPVPGDLVFFHNSRNKIYHVGIYIGDGKMIHAPRTGKNISVLEISKFNGTVHGYYHYD